MITTEQRQARDIAIENFLVNGDWEAFVAALSAVSLIADESEKSDESDENVANLDEINAELARAADLDRGLTS